jgi:DNA-directed RNA polymerase subunit RPC12/RpoP
MSYKIRKARKEYKCVDCGKPIFPGQKYADTRRLSAKGSAFRYCLSCDDKLWERKVEESNERRHQAALDSASQGWDDDKSYFTR